ncbi:glycosyl hydrolase [Mucilaginibacter xinganensis]|uniref:Glycoside hydrolase family 2 n=1 Tax=Mucilaginibacter xinganensis TaxID=1234841 RepID=A0A223NYE9_9SPHI|nr:glycosyl hydrolase [Mucilaginibacter xinganensis]ASU34724.1 glycoside hydrolase family 2 [Mucilaginibacter xinganensis]
MRAIHLTATVSFVLNFIFIGALSHVCLADSYLDTGKTTVPAANMLKLEKDFISIPNAVQTSIYWYWISGNISKQGVIRDLESMKKVGINRAFIGNIGLTEVPNGKVKLFSNEWWDIMHTALKTATKLGIEIGIFNSPGWSQSGGPWVKPEQAMRYLTSSKITVSGQQTINLKLVQPQKDFQDVRVIAYPVPAGYNSDISSIKPVLKSSPEINNLNELFDNNYKTGVKLKEKQGFTIDISTPAAYTVRSLVISPDTKAMSFDGDIQVLLNGTYQSIKHFSVDRSNNALNVGFSPHGPAAISIPATKSASYRIVFTNASADAGINELKLSGTPVVENYIEKTLAKMWQTPYPYWTAYQWQQQPAVDDKSYLIDPAKVLDISKYMAADGTLKWQVPAGNWMIERTGMTPTQVQNSPAPPEGTGLEADKMSKKHIRAHFDAFLGEIQRRIPAADRKTWKVTVEDSYETGGQNWSDHLVENFKKVYGYDPVPYIPVLQGTVVGSEDQSDRFLWDLRRFIADNVAYQYVAGLREISHEHGLTTWLENYGHWGFPGEFLQYGGQSDEVGGEFWSEGSLGNIENRAASSCAHIYGKNKVSAESFTCGGASYSRYPAMMKQRADRFFTEGINNTLMHVYIEQPYEDKFPGVNAPFGNEFNRHNTWFYDMDIFIKYIKRCNMMLQQGKYVADVAYFISEDAPKMTGTQDPELPLGYSFDYINGEVIKTRLAVKNGKLMLPDGLNYSILVLPKLETIRPELLLKISELVKQGAVVLGPKPMRSPSLQNYPAADNHVQKLADELWGNIDGKTVKVNKLGLGMVIDGMSLQEALNLVKVIPDIKTEKTDSVLFIHRRLQKGSVYFLSNQTNKSIAINPKFRIAGKRPELWDPATGKVRVLPAYTQNSSTTSVPLSLAPLESAFIVFTKPGKKGDTHRENYPDPIKAVTINTPWKVKYDSKMRGPVKPVVFNTLTDWSKNANDSIKYYSGSAWYHNTFSMQGTKKSTVVFLDLGMVKGIAKVKVNGVDMGGVWTAPYKVDITKALKNGINTVEIKVVNTWVNRLVGDSMLPVAERKTWTNYNTFTPQSSLEASGLLGPVQIETIKY